LSEFAILLKTEYRVQPGTLPMMDSSLRALLADRLDALELRIQAACRRARRPRADVQLVAVTKTVAPEVAALLPELGVVDLGENRPQELWRKAAALPPGIRWHLIGHLQRNKVERTLPLVHLIHSVDSPRLLETLNREAQRQDSRLPLLLEINASGESNKHGFAPADVPGLPTVLRNARYVEVVGLMTMAALEADPEQCRATFVTLRNLRDQLRNELAPLHPLPHLSMGMTNDFEVAIEEGATLIRVGSALFADLPEDGR
jgi:pyridoxal phosphate enzyme (YggS family)